MLCSPVWHECMRLTRRWWEVGGEKPSYNFTTSAAAPSDDDAAAWSLQQVSILKGVEGGKGRECCSLQLAVQRDCYIDVLTRLSSSWYDILKLKFRLVCTRCCIIRTCRLSEPAGLESLSGTLR